MQKLIDAFGLLAILGFLLTFFKPSLILSQTTTTGGDMGSHFVIAHYLKHYLLPNGKVIGWYPHWFAGVPMLQFYFVPPYVLMAAMSTVMPLEVAFKLVTVSGVFLLPIATFLSFKILGFRFPAPLLAASSSLLLLFVEDYSIYGGNIKSVLAGEFSYEISFALAILSAAMVWKTSKEEKHTVVLPPLLALVALTHVYTTILLASLVSLLMGERLLGKDLKAPKRLSFVCFTALMLSGFWTIPMLAKRDCAMPVKDVFYGLTVETLRRAIVPSFLPFYLLALALPLSWKRLSPEERGAVRLLFLLLALAATLYLVSSGTILLNVRFLPFVHFIPLLLAAVFVGKLLEARGGVVALLLIFATMGWVSYGVDELPLLGPKLRGVEFLSQGVRDVPVWIRWNYEGLEAKRDWKLLKELWQHLSSLKPDGRINFEYTPIDNGLAAYGKFGTPRVFEVTPIFTNRSVMEGLLLESSLTFPFFFYIQREVSKDCWWPGFGIEVPSLNLERGARDMWLYNVKYFIASSEVVKAKARESPSYELLTAVEGFEVYRLNEDSSYVDPLIREPILVVTDNWEKFAFRWISSDHNLTLLVFSRDLDSYELERFRLIVLDKPVKIQEKPGVMYFEGERWLEAMKEAKVYEEACWAEEVVREEEVLINTSCVGRPLVVKISYFPNWQVEGAKKIYLATPSLMLIFPEKGVVRIHYGSLPVDWFGVLCSVAGIILLAAKALWLRRSQ